METIVIGFSKPRGWFVPVSWLIRLAERTRYSHAYIKVKSESLNRELIYQATGSGVYFVGKATFELKAEPLEEYEFKITKERKTELLRWAVDTSGKPYGKLQILGLGLKRVCRAVGINIKNPFKTGTGAYVCTELAAEALKEIKVLSDLELDDIGLLELRSLVLRAFWSQNLKP